MKVKVKKLNGTHFEIEIKLQDTVSNVKKNIETVRGPNVYPAAGQMLIHQGKLLQDDTTMEENEVSDNSFIVVMLSMATNTRPATPPPAPAAAPPPQPPLAGAGPPPAVNPRPQATQPPPASPSTPNANPVNLFPHDLPARNFDLIRHLRNSRTFHALRSAMRANPLIIPRMYQVLWNYSQWAARLIYENRHEVIRLIFEPVEGEENGFGQPAFTVTREDMDAMDRLEAMGFSSLLVWQAYFTCDKNEELALYYLLDHMREFGE